MSERPNLQMQDFAETDKRSVSAMLHGHGDGREKPFLEFEARAQLVDPLLDDEEIGEFYRRHCHERGQEPGEAKGIAKPNAILTWLRRWRWTLIARHLVMGSVMAVALFKVSSFLGW